MKNSKWINLTALCFILSLTVACGGKNSSGGGSSTPFTTVNPIKNSSSNLLAPGLRNTSSGEQVVHIFNQALSYRNNSSETGSILAAGFTRGQLTGYSNPTSDNCKTGTFLKFFEYNYCKGSSSTTGQTISFATTPTQFCTVLNDNNKLAFAKKVQNDLPYNYYGCNLPNKVEYSKDKNEDLNKVLSLNNGSWHLFGASQSGSVIYLMVGAKDSSPSLLYAIDTSYHSVYNPVSIQGVQVYGNQVQTVGNATKTLILQ